MVMMVVVMMVMSPERSRNDVMMVVMMILRDLHFTGLSFTGGRCLREPRVVCF
jgi:hypothetical protein